MPICDRLLAAVSKPSSIAVTQSNSHEFALHYRSWADSYPSLVDCSTETSRTNREQECTVADCNTRSIDDMALCHVHRSHGYCYRLTLRHCDPHREQISNTYAGVHVRIAAAIRFVWCLRIIIIAPAYLAWGKIAFHV